MEHGIETVLQNRSVQIAMLLVCGVALAGGGIWWGYSYYATARNRKAQLIFAEQLDQLERMRMNPEATPDMWNMVEQGFNRAYQANKSSSLAPYLLAGEADAVMHEGDQDRAIALLDTAVSQMRHVPALYYLYAIKLGTMRLDATDNSVREQGRRELLSYAQDTKNPYQGLAWYYLWVHAWSSGDADLYQLASTKLKSFQEWERLIHEKLGVESSSYEIS